MERLRMIQSSRITALAISKVFKICQFHLRPCQTWTFHLLRWKLPNLQLQLQTYYLKSHHQKQRCILHWMWNWEESFERGVWRYLESKQIWSRDFRKMTEGRRRKPPSFFQQWRSFRQLHQKELLTKGLLLVMMVIIGGRRWKTSCLPPDQTWDLFLQKWRLFRQLH